MALTVAPSMATAEARRIVGGLVRRHRMLAGLSQEELVSALGGAGVQLSRSHLSNIERGEFALRDEQLLGIDRALGLDGELVAQVSAQLGRPVAGRVWNNPWSELGRALGEGLVDDPWLAVDEEFRALAMPAPEARDVAPVVIDGTQNLEQYVVGLLLNLATTTTPSFERAPIQVSGLVSPGLHDSNSSSGGRHAGLPLPVRKAMRYLMELGWQIEHFARSPSDSLEEADLARVLAPLIPCSQYHPRIVDESQGALVESILLLPDAAAVQFFSRRRADVLDSAIVYHDAHSRQLLGDRLQMLSAGAHDFVERFERAAMPSPDPELTSDEIRFRQILVDMALEGGNADFLIGTLPNCSEPTELYRKRVLERARHCRRTPESVWEEVIASHAQRHQAFMADVQSGERFRILVRLEDLKRWTHLSEPPWAAIRGASYPAYLETLENLAREHSNLEIRLFPDVPAQPRRTLRWEVRHGRADASSGQVLIQTTHHPVRVLGAEELSSQSLPVDLRIRTGGVVKAFAALFNDLWDHPAVVSDSEAVFKELKAVRP